MAEKVCGLPSLLSLWVGCDDYMNELGMIEEQKHLNWLHCTRCTLQDLVHVDSPHNMQQTVCNQIFLAAGGHPKRSRWSTPLLAGLGFASVGGKNGGMWVRDHYR